MGRGEREGRLVGKKRIVGDEEGREDGMELGSEVILPGKCNT